MMKALSLNATVSPRTGKPKTKRKKNSKEVGNMLVKQWTQLYRQSRSNYSRIHPWRRWSSTLPLSHIKVVDLTRVLAGPYCTMMLGDLGAQVWKVERPKMGDITRQWGPPWVPATSSTDSPMSAYYMCVNRNKRSITVDFTCSEGRDILHKMISQCDVLVENYLPGTLKKYGLDYPTVSRINSRIIYASITGYGQSGPYASNPGFDVMIEAEGGLMYITGEEDGDPVKVGVAITDVTTGLHAHNAILAALLTREKTHHGQHLDISLLDCQVASLANIASNFLIANKEAKRWGTAHPSIVPYQAFNTKTDPILIGAGTPKQFTSLCRILNRPKWLETYSTNSERVQHRKQLVRDVEEVLMQHPVQHWMEKFKNSGIPVAPINNIEQTFDHPQIVHRQLVQESVHPVYGKAKLVGPPVKYSGFQFPEAKAPPLLGEHSEEIMSELGYSSEKIQELKSKRII